MTLGDDQSPAAEAATATHAASDTGSGAARADAAGADDTAAAVAAAGSPPGAEPEPEPETRTGRRAEKRDTKRKSTRWIVELVVVACLAVVIAVLLRTFVVATYSIPSGSMEPTLQVGDRIMVNKLSYHLHGIGVGDIIVFSTPPTEDCGGPPVPDLVKRVIGLPGQTVSLRNGRVLIDGRVLPEPWLPPATRTQTSPGPDGPYSLNSPYRVPSGDVYVMGDNREASCDSRYWGPVRESSIVGKVDVRIWPPSRIGLF